MRSRAVVVLVAYLGCALALPELHRRHHAAHGDDHVHTPEGVVWLPAPTDESAAAHHAAFDADLAALGLAEVAHAGAAAVDCALAAYTLVACEDARADHPHTFGDELLARTHHARHPRDPLHGRGALLHLAGWLLAPAPALPPPPPLPTDEADFALRLRTLHPRAAAASGCRGPPALRLG